MFEIIKKELISTDTYLFDVYVPRIASSVLPGQFLIVKLDEKGERVPLTVTDYDPQRGSVAMVFKAIGVTTSRMAKMEVGDRFSDVVGPLGRASDFYFMSDEERKNKKFVFVGGGVGIAPIYPQIKWLYEHGVKADCIIGARTKSLLFFTENLSKFSNLYITTDDDSSDHKGLVTDMLKTLIAQGKNYDEVVAIGPMIMMKFVAQVAKEHGIHSVVSLNSLMVDGTGMCGACRVTVGGQTKFTCVDGPEFDGALVDFDEALKRQAMYDNVETKKILDAEEKEEGHECHIGGVIDEERDKSKQVPIAEQDPKKRSKNFKEVCLGYSADEAVMEARRCLNCKNAMCMKGCPVNINIPAFIMQIAHGNFAQAAEILLKDTALPAVCGRVCPQESQCEGRCVLGKKGEPVAIGKLERFIGDWVRENGYCLAETIVENGNKVAVIGSGPAGITCAKELRVKGYDVTVFEALHHLGGVLVYGIPSFRLPKETVVNYEIESVKRLGVKFETNVVVGRTVTIDGLMEKEGYKAVFIASGAGLPKFMGIPGENLCGVVSANEFLTRNNLLFAYKEGYMTPNFVGRKVVVVGGGNVAMDAARTALRLGAEVNVVYRRSESELPARIEEVKHAKEEGVVFNLLCNPVEIIGNEKGWINAVKCVRMTLGEPDESGRRRPVVVPDSEFVIEADMLIMSLGTSPNPLIASTTPNLSVNKWDCIVADEQTLQTSRTGVFAGGDAVSGAATVILAMGAGKTAANSIDEYIKSQCC